jgi:Flp pilus assembly pilin Flp
MLRSATDALALAVLRVYVRFRVERGQTLAEYGVMVSVLVAFVIVTVLIAFRDAVSVPFSDLVGCFDGTCEP